MRLSIGLAAWVLLAAMPATKVAAQDGSGPPDAGSAYDCHNLHLAEPAILEGLDGVFYRLEHDMRMNHPLSEQTADLVGQLSRALEARGVTLIYVPVPTKSQAMPEYLHDSAAAWGHDPEIARKTYVDFVERLREVGVTTVDAQTVLQDVEGEEPAFIPTDFHWTSTGARAVAEAVGDLIRKHPDFADFPSLEYATERVGWKTLPSQLRRIIQGYCRKSVPEARTVMFTTSPEKRSASGGIFAKESGGPIIAITGTSMSDLKEPNFAGFIGQATGLDYANYSIAGGNQYGAISAYLLSEEFQENPPAFLVWENPIYNNLGEFGGQPLEELIASARNDCRPLPTSRDGDASFTAALSGNIPAARDFIRVTTGGERARSVEIAFVDKGGLSHGTSINRPVRADPTERFYQSVRPFWREDLTEIRIRFDRRVADAAAVAVCTTEETEG